MTCQALFARKARKGLTMIDFTEEETQALPAVMRALAPELERIGWDRPLGQLTANDMHRLIVIDRRGVPRRDGQRSLRTRRSRSDAGLQPEALDGRAHQRPGRCRARGRTRRHAAARLSRRLPARPRLRAGAAVRVHRHAEGRGRRLRRPDPAHLRHRPRAGGPRDPLAARRRARSLHPEGKPTRRRAVRLLGRRRPRPRPCRRHHRRRARPRSASAFPRSGNARP